MRRTNTWLRLVFATVLAVSAVALTMPVERLSAAVPSRSSVSPADGATNVSPTTSLTITFNIPVSQGTGLIELKKVNNPSAVQSFNVATSSAITGWNTSTITITLATLSENTEYYVNYPSTAFRDGTTSDYAAGVTGNTTWNFRTSGVPWDVGNGTSSTPWVITSCLELISIDANSSYWDDYFELGNNVDCTGTTVFPMMVGAGSTQFTGKIDGKNFTISNLTITCPADFGCGLFKNVSSGASFSNLNLSTVNINQTSSTYYNVGSLFGSQSGTIGAAVTVSNISATGLNISNANAFSGGIAGDCDTCIATNISTAGSITGKQQVGGIFGRLGDSSSTAATLSNSSSSATIVATMNSTSSTQTTGGLIGSYPMSSSATEANRTLSDLTFSGSVTGDSSDIGGIVGDADYAVFRNVTSTGAVTGYDDVGGIVGDLTNSSLTFSRSSGTIHATRTDNCSGQAGGLVGTFSSSTISKSYSTATVKGHCRIGGLIGGASPTTSATFIENSYFVGSLVQIATGTYAGLSMGGLVGVSNATATIAKSYAVVTSATNASTRTFKGLIGERYSPTQTVTCSSVYWDKDISSITADGVCGTTPGKSTSDMKSQSTFSGFDFTNDWQIDGSVNSGYPTLQAFSSSSTTTTTTTTTAPSTTTSTTTTTTTTTAPSTTTSMTTTTTTTTAPSATTSTTSTTTTSVTPETTSTNPEPTPISRTISITGAASRYTVTQDGPGLTAVPSAGGGAISWSSLTPSVCSVSSIAMMSILSSQSSVEVGRLNVVGTCTISASVAATSTHVSASTRVSFTVTRARPTVTVSTFDDEHFFAKISLPSAIASSSALLRDMYDDLRFVSLTPEACEIDLIATYQESASEFGPSWIGLHGQPIFIDQGACTVRAELPLGDRWFRIFSTTNATIGEDVEQTTTTLSPVVTVRPTTTTVGASGTATTVPSTTTVLSSETTSLAPGITSFGPTSSVATVPILQLDIEKQIVLESGETEIVFSRESLIRTAENVGVQVGAIRLRTASSGWMETKLPDASDLRLIIRQTDVELNIEVAPELGKVIRIAVPIVISIESGFELRNFTLAFLIGAALMAWWLLAWRKRRQEGPTARS